MDTYSIQGDISSITYKAKLRLIICNEDIWERASLRTIRPSFPRATALISLSKDLTNQYHPSNSMLILFKDFVLLRPCANNSIPWFPLTDWCPHLLEEWQEEACEEFTCGT